ncbi:hypothetical protein ACS0TY_021635 [Phlomoides rotata]
MFNTTIKCLVRNRFFFLNTHFFEYQLGELEDFHVLKWWSRRSTLYPVLSLIAKEVYACPVSTVATEQGFSMGGHTLNSRLAVEHLEN